VSANCYGSENLKDSVLDPAKHLIHFFDTGSRIQKFDRLHSREVVFFGIEPVANRFCVTQDGERVLVKHGQVVECIRFSVRESALLAPAAQGPAVNADELGERSHRYTEKRSQLFQPFDRQAASDLFAYSLWGFDGPLDRLFEARAHREGFIIGGFRKDLVLKQYRQMTILCKTHVYYVN